MANRIDRADRVFFGLGATIAGTVALIMVFAVGECALNVGRNLSGAAKAQALKSAQQFAAQMNMPKVDCMEFDTDGDGYISCTMFDGDSMPTAIECASFLNSGCRLVLPVKMNGVR